MAIYRRAAARPRGRHVMRPIPGDASRKSVEALINLMGEGFPRVRKILFKMNGENALIDVHPMGEPASVGIEAAESDGSLDTFAGKIQ